ncbi:MAG: hypothetical protein M5U15_12595 [Kiritimatiellae bacterium]|nr:hypothetical protein [Kiritimatiellia bacterium]
MNQLLDEFPVQRLAEVLSVSARERFTDPPVPALVPRKTPC